MKPAFLSLALAAGATMAHAGVITTTNLAEVAAFQQGLSVQTFENVSGRTPLAVDSFPTEPVAVDPGALVYDEVPGFQFSSGFTPGEVMAGLIQVEANNGGGDAGSINTVLVGLSQTHTTQFERAEQIEAYLPQKVSSLGFWVSPELGRVRVHFLSSNFAFNPDETEEVWASVEVQAGQFVGYSRDAADIGGLKIIALSDAGFAIDDLSYGGSGGTQPLPEPTSAWLALLGLVAAASTSARGRSAAHRRLPKARG